MPRHLACHVVSKDRITPAVRRLVIGGADLAAFAVPPGALGPYLKLHLPGPAGRDLIRTYSIRRHDAARDEVTIDVVCHPGGAGSDFALRAAAGDAIRLSGPGFIPAEPCAAYLLAGDHTALPAIAHILDMLPADVTVSAVIEVPGPDEVQALPPGHGDRVIWLHRVSGARSRLADTVREIWPEESSDLLVWAGAEAAIARAVRRHARATRGISPARCQVLNYWKAGEPEGGFSYMK